MTDNELEVLQRAAQPVVELAVAEDVGLGDATSIATLPADLVLQGHIRAKAPGVIAGLRVAEVVFHRIDPHIDFTPRVIDGQEIIPGEVVADVTGPARSLLAAERTALNFLQRMSGVATLTRRYVDAVACTPAAILDTRKTVPGHRILDKYAVRMGGGLNHRLSLSDMILIKDNHVDASGGIGPAVARSRAAYPRLPVEVEVRTLDELGEALNIAPPVDRIMLDNMDLETMRQAASVVSGRVPLEASGNVTLERAGDIAATGVDCLSVGSLTHSAPALDLSMKVDRPRALGTLSVQERTDQPATGRSLAVSIADSRASLGDRLVILGHHYQRDEVLAFADFVGDSLQLAHDSARTDAETIVFCGVHFMAETAAILAKPGQHVLIPDLTAGCYLADTAALGAVAAAWNWLDTALGNAATQLMPITYVNSSADLKAFCGQHGGIVCTSSSAERAIHWALEQRPHLFFFPDQHLGRNTARRLGIPLDEILLWNPSRPPDPADCSRARVILWPGACNVHQRFRPEHVRQVRARYPGIRVLVHPECRPDVVGLADDIGSTSHILGQIAAAPPGCQWAVGTESRMVQRLQKEHPEQRIISLADVPPFCRTMGQTTLSNLDHVLQALARGQLINEVTVYPDTAHWARQALERMLRT